MEVSKILEFIKSKVIKFTIGDRVKEYSFYPETKGSSGFDIRAYGEDEHVIFPGSYATIMTGLHLQIPKGYEGQIRSRSGLAYFNGVVVLNSPGTIDSDFRGEIKVILINHGKQDYTVRLHDRIAQIVFSKVVYPRFKRVKSLDETERGGSGFGSTGR